MKKIEKKPCLGHVPLASYTEELKKPGRRSVVKSDVEWVFAHRKQAIRELRMENKYYCFPGNPKEDTHAVFAFRCGENNETLGSFTDPGLVVLDSQVRVVVAYSRWRKFLLSLKSLKGPRLRKE
ncbi:hypothetical protein K2P56_04315 [Patescibacteria group bacterium]|nr:hypothetical protein [Patescibacteria group bacterium]